MTKEYMMLYIVPENCAIRLIVKGNAKFSASLML